MGCQSTRVMQQIVTEPRCVVASALISLGLLLAPSSFEGLALGVANLSRECVISG